MLQLSEQFCDWGSNWRSFQQARKQEAMLKREKELQEIRSFINNDSAFYLPSNDGSPVLSILNKDDKQTQEELKDIIRQERRAASSRYGHSRILRETHATQT